MVKENIFIIIKCCNSYQLVMKGIGKMMNEQAKEFISMIIMINLQEDSKMARERVMENIIMIQTILYLKESGATIIKMVRVN